MAEFLLVPKRRQHGTLSPGSATKCPAWPATKTWLYGALKRKRPSILVVDDELGKAQALSVAVKLAGFHSSFVGSADAAFKFLAEWTVMKGHVQIGYALVTSIPLLREAAELVFSHHERFDGTGYPRELRGEQIPLCARIFAIADAFDAMTTPRPYQSTKSLFEASKEIARFAGQQFDPQVVDAFAEIPMAILETIHGKTRQNPEAPTPQFEGREHPACLSHESSSLPVVTASSGRPSERIR